MRNAATILIVEDDERIRNYMRTVLASCDYAVLETGNAKTALSIVASHNPDLVILDLGLPDRDGQELLSEMRQWSRVPVVVISARGLEKDKVTALDNGADDYITKPFGTDELLARIRAALRHGRQRNEGERTVFSGNGLVVDSLHRARAMRVDAMRRFGPALYAPMQADGRGVGVLVLLRLVGSQPFGRSDLATAESYAAQAALALVLAEARHKVVHESVGRMGETER